MTKQSDLRVQILRTGPVPSSETLGPEFLVHDLTENTIDVPPAIALSTRAIAAAGRRKITDALMAQLPNLGIIANFGVGYDRVDVESATRRGIVVSNTPDVLTDEVADFTLGLLIATVRRIPAADAFLREGSWTAGTAFPLSASLRGRRVGIVGMGRIGAAIARRVSAMDLDVAYHSRTPKPDLPFRRVASLLALAEECDVLIVVVPGSSETDGLVNARIIEALGPRGILINVARGSVVDEAALIAALKSGKLQAAGLDVFPDEPRVSPTLIGMSNVVLTPHIGSATTTTRQAMGDLLLANIKSWCGGGGALTPVNDRDLTA
jgi:lactate dehydrogenase-like 2-hydroxyacid dehydrogenase